MKKIVFVLFFVCFVVSDVVEYSFPQLRDHTNSQDQSTFTQYYWVNEDYYQDGGPTLVYLSSMALPQVDLTRSAVSDWGQDLKAVLIELQVRYSGDSLPSTNFTSNEFAYQSPTQNIEDIVSLQQQFFSIFPQYSDSPWILIGEYLNANYVIWARQSYPSNFLGAVGIAGPVLAVEEFPEYFQYWSTIATEECAAPIHTAIEETESAFVTGEKEYVKEAYGCPNVIDDRQFFYVIAQVTTFGLGSYRSQLCDAMKNATDAMDTYAKAISDLLILSGVPDCNDWNIAGDTDPSDSFRPTYYLYCAYLGQFETSGYPTDTTIVSDQVDSYFYLNTCEILFKEWLVPAIDETNNAYNGLHPTGSNYAFVTSTSDPFRYLVVNDTDLPQSDIIRIVTAESIFEFLRDTISTNSIEAGRDAVYNLMEQWLNESTSSPSPSPNNNNSNNNTPVSHDSKVNWSLYLYMVVGCLCTIIVTGLVGYRVIKYAERVIARKYNR